MSWKISHTREYQRYCIQHTTEGNDLPFDGYSMSGIEGSSNAGKKSSISSRSASKMKLLHPAHPDCAVQAPGLYSQCCLLDVPHTMSISFEGKSMRWSYIRVRIKVKKGRAMSTNKNVTKAHSTNSPLYCLQSSAFTEEAALLFTEDFTIELTEREIPLLILWLKYKINLLFQIFRTRSQKPRRTRFDKIPPLHHSGGEVRYLFTEPFVASASLGLT